MNIHFSIRAALRQARHIFMERPWFYVVLMIVPVLGVITPENNSLFFKICTGIIAFIWVYVWYAAALDAVDGKNEKLTLASLKHYLPTIKQVVFVFLTSMLVVAGLVLAGIPAIVFGILFIFFTALGKIGLIGFLVLLILILPVLYISVRLMFSAIVYVDQKISPFAAVKTSWKMTKGSFWTALVVIIVVGCLEFIGAILFGIGLFIMYPIASFILVQYYRSLQTPSAPIAPTVEPEVIQE